MAHSNRPQLRILDDSNSETDWEDTVCITGLGLCAATGKTREEVWQSIQAGRLGARRLTEKDNQVGLRLPAAMCDWLEIDRTEHRAIAMVEQASREAMIDAGYSTEYSDRPDFACTIASHFTDVSHTGNLQKLANPEYPWWAHWLPDEAAHRVSQRYGLHGPRGCITAACATGLISIITAARSILDRRCNRALAGGGDAVDQFVLAAFARMGVLADDQDASIACRPFDRDRKGFVIGEGAAMFVLERKSDAIARGAQIYADILSTKMLSEAAHLTSLDNQSEAYVRLIQSTLRSARLRECDLHYINAHGTGTEQNDRNELYGITTALGESAEQVCVSSVKGMLGHTINAAGAIELAVTALALRDGYAPPTMNLHRVDSESEIDCLPEIGEARPLQYALKTSLAFGGHLAAMALGRDLDHCRAALPLSPNARIRTPSAVPNAA